MKRYIFVRLNTGHLKGECMSPVRWNLHGGVIVVGFPRFQQSHHLEKMWECIHGLPAWCDYCFGFPMLQQSLMSAEDE